MNRIASSSMIILLVAHFAPATAAVFQRDWKTPGDGLLTYDHVNQREWLDVPLTLMEQFSGDSIESRFQSALAELQSGGMYDGFELSNMNDLLGLAKSAGIDTSTTDFVTNEAAVNSLLDLLGRTVAGTGGSSATALLSDVVQGPPSDCPCQLVATVGAGQAVPDFAGLRFYSTAEILVDNEGISATGLYLYRQLPEPSSIFQLACGLLFSNCFVGLRRSRLLL